jgi:drug/metabolite transporter (DMT)-like permease
LIWPVTIILDKIILSKWIKKPAVYVMLIGIIELVVLLGIPFFGFKVPELTQLVIALVVGALAFYGYVFYVRALSMEEASRVSPLFQIEPIFVFLLAFFLVGERLTYNELIAFFLLLAGGAIVSLKPVAGTKRFRVTIALLPMLAATLIFAASVALTKYVFLHQAFWDGFVQMRVGFFLGVISLLAFKSFRQDFKREALGLSSKAKLVLIGTVFLGLIALVFWNLAVAVGGPVSIISALEGLEPLLVFAYALALSFWVPRVLREEVTLSVVLLKLVAMLLMAGGIIVLALA